jgi:hypothetical protein
MNFTRNVRGKSFEQIACLYRLSGNEASINNPPQKSEAVLRTTIMQLKIFVSIAAVKPVQPELQ